MRNSKEILAQNVFFLSAIASAVMILAIFGFMIALGIPLFTSGNFLAIWAGPWAPHEGLYGIWSMISGTLWIALLATALCLPLSLGTSFVITSLGGQRLRRMLGTLVRFMTGIPTVIYGFVGIFLLVPLVRSGIRGAGMCVLTAGVILAILISPTMILFFTDSLLAVDSSYVQAAKALGAGRKTKDEPLDLSIGISLLKKVGDEVTAGEPLAVFHSDGDEEKIILAKEKFLAAYKITGNKVRPPKLFYARISREGVEQF